MVEEIVIKGARLHNLKNIDLVIPHNKLVVISGVSGSGKSTLAFDTIYAESQRRFVESLSAYARQFLERLAKPDVDSITGLPPALAIQQKPLSKNPRSTVGTTTEVYDYLRLLFARIGKTICKCGKEVKKHSPSDVVKELENLNENERIYIMFPIQQENYLDKFDYKKYKELGFFRVVNTEAFEIEELREDLKNISKYSILVDRLVYRKEQDTFSRLQDSIETAMKVGEGRVQIRLINSEQTLIFSNKYECPYCEIIYQEPEPRLFSFNNPYGACPHCQGFGRTIDIDENLVIPDRNKSIESGAISILKHQSFLPVYRRLIELFNKKGIPTNKPINELTENEYNLIWEGEGNYIGLNKIFEFLEEKKHQKVQYRVLLSKYRGFTKCKHCGGSRIRTSARRVFVNGKNIPELIKMNLDDLLEFIKNLELSEFELKISEQIISEIKWRLQLLVDIGLEYLTLDRLSHTLSGGEAQRINLSTALGSSLVGTLYILDEPSIGLHPTDTEKLINILFKLRNLGNTIIVVEHDPDIISKADYVIDIGPYAGENGGKVIFAGKYKDLLKTENSITAQYLSGKKKIEIPTTRNPGNGKKITIFKPRENNLQIDKVSIPLGCLNVVTGVSGSGKSSLLIDVFYTCAKRYLSGFEIDKTKCEAIKGLEYIDGIELVDQSPIGKSTRSTPVTYIKAYEYIREIFAETQLAKQLGYKAGSFSFNIPGGRCDVCEGEGIVSVDMQFLPDVHLECEACKGTRFKKEIRNILYKGKSIVDVLNMTIDEAIKFFSGEKRILQKLQVLSDVGLGYLKLGQPSTMLSGGEAQRIKLAYYLDATIGNNLLFIFDEPTTGLHLDDISKLLKCIRKLIEAGHTVIVIEHNLYVIYSADWIIDLGPGAGNQGGKIVATGTPEQILTNNHSKTAKALKEFIKKNFKNNK